MTCAQTTPLQLTVPEEAVVVVAAAAVVAAAVAPEPAVVVAAAQVEGCQRMLQHQLRIRRRYQVLESFSKQIS